MCRNLYKLLFLLGCVIHPHGVLSDNGEDNWIEPNAWAREQQLTNVDAHNALEKSKPHDVAAVTDEIRKGVFSNNEMAVVYYKKLIGYLFNRQKLEYDSTTGKYKRSVLFTLLPEQLEKLEQLNDVRDIDNVLTEILLKVRAPNKFDFNGSTGHSGGLGIGALFLDILKDLLQLLKISEIQFALIVTGVIMLCWFCHRRYNIGIIALILGVIFCYGYFHTYLECNRKLEAERMLEAIERNQATLQNEVHWYTPILRFFSSSESNQQTRQQFIKQSSKLNMAFCRPDHVFIQYANDLFLTQLEFLIEKCTTSFLTLKDRLSFPFNYLAAVMMVLIITYVLKLTFKYILSPRAWAALLQTNTIHPPNYTYQQQPQVQQQLTANATAVTEDRISGENLRRLLHLVGSGGPNMQFSSSSLVSLPASGVEEVLEQLEAKSVATTDSSNSNTPNTSMEEDTKREVLNNNTSSPEEMSADRKDVRLEDLPEEKNA